MTEHRGRGIKQFMWGYQSPFRISAEVSLRMTLEEIGFTGEVDVLLVGFEAAGSHAFPICIEPEDGPYDPAMLSSVDRRGQELYEQHSDHNMHYSDARSREEIPKSLQRAMRAKAIEELLAASAPGADRAFFASTPVGVDDYDVHVVISIDRASLTRVPQLHTTMRDRFRIHPSLVHAIIDDALKRAIRTLYMPDPGLELGVLQGLPPEIVQSAATTFVRSVFTCADYWSGERSGATVNAISALPYEGRPGVGRMVIAEADHPAVDVLMRFTEAVDIENTQAVRKLLEASGSAGDLLSTGDKVFGLGRLTEVYDATTETAFIISVTARGAWELSHAHQVLMTVHDGIPHLLSRPPLNTAYFNDTVERLLPDPDPRRLLALAEAAGQHQHGAMLVISSDAGGEAQRLAPQAWSVEPVQLEPELLRQLTSMDGGVLIDGQGYCHAIGVILDGQACGGEDPARGSRFNNAVRYLKNGSPPAVVVVYSADGGIDILPCLRPRVQQSVVLQAVERYLSLATPGEYQFGRTEARGQVKSLRFYLSEDQCRRVNEASAALERWDKERGNLHIIEEPFTPNPEMNETYWLPEKPS